MFFFSTRFGFDKVHIILFLIYSKVALSLVLGSVEVPGRQHCQK